MDTTGFTIKSARLALKKKEISSLELVKACISKVRLFDKAINAFITVTEEKAIQDAKRADDLIAKGEDRELLGIPFTLKDVFNTEGIRTTAGSKILDNYTSPYNASIYQNIIDAGGILIGKTNCDAFGHGSSTENSDFGPTKNPWDLTRVAGGSSGGSAAALAYGAGLFSIAEDTGGSIRQPASFCNITGLKPTWGMVSRHGCIAYASSLDTVGPMAKTAEDVSTIMDVIAKEDSLDNSQSQKILRNYHEGLTRSSHMKLTIGLPKEFFSKGNEKEIDLAIDQTCKELKQLGHQFKEVSLPHTKHAVECYYLIAACEASSNLARYDGIRYGRSRDHFNQENKRRIMLGTFALSAGYLDKYYLKARKVKTLIYENFKKVFRDNIDCILAPVSPTLAFKLGEKTSDPLQMYLEDIYTVPANIASLPSLALPCGFSKTGLPIGVQIMGDHFSENLLLGLGYQYQQVTGWHERRPTL